jgi:hypothetical protein
MIKNNAQPDNTQAESEEQKEVHPHEDVRANLMAILDRLRNNQQVNAMDIEDNDIEHNRPVFNQGRVRRNRMRDRLHGSINNYGDGENNIRQQGSCGEFAMGFAGGFLLGFWGLVLM